MELTQVATLIAQHGGLLGLSIFAIWMLNKVWEARLAEAERHAQAEFEMRCAVLDALNRNTKALAQLRERLPG